MILTSVLAVALSLPSTAAQREAVEAASAVGEAQSPLEAAAALAKVERLLPHLGAVADVIRQLDLGASKWARSPSVGAGEVTSWAHRLEGLLELARGRPERARARMRGLGYLDAILVSKPAVGSCDVKEAPPVPTVGADWRELNDVAPAGSIELEQLASSRRGEALMLATELDVDAAGDADGRAAIYLGASGPSALAVDGRWIARDAARHPAHPDQLRVPLTLSPGRHLVELRLCRDERPLEVSLRLAGPNGRPARRMHFASWHPGLAVGATASPTASPKPPREPERGGDLGTIALKQKGSAAAEVLEALTPWDDSSHVERDARQAACEAEPTQGCWLGVLELARRERRGIDAQVALQRARSIGPGTARLALAEATLALDLGYPDRALASARAAKALDPDDDEPLLAEAQALESMGMQGMAATLELEAARRFPGSPDAQMAGAYRNERLHREGEARRELRLLLGLRPDLLGARESLERLLISSGDIQGALDLLVGEQRLLPLSARPLLLEGRLRLANAGTGHAGQSDRREGRALLQAAADLGRWNADDLGELAEIELAQGRGADGRAELRAALALSPQAPQLRELERQLGHPDDEFAHGFLADLRRVASESPPSPGEDAVVLSDVTAIQVYPSGLSTRIHQLIVRAQTQRGVEAARVTPIAYDPDRQDLRLLTARVLEPGGQLTSTFEESTRSLSEPWYDLYYDQRERDVGLPTLAPGDVLEVTYRLDDIAKENLLADSFGDIVFLQDVAPRERFTYAVAMPPGRELVANRPAVKGLSFRLEPRADGGKSYVWTAGQVPKLIPEPRMPGWAEVAPYLEVSTERSWAALGDTYWDLVHGQLEPTAEIRSIAKELADHAGDSLAARAAAAYDYVVSHTRYVGLELGIHGYRPYPVGEVLDRGFGDCKDKASLLWSFLRALGIDSNLVLLRTRPLGRLAEGPASFAVFDHAILYVPALDRFFDATARFHGSTELPADDQGASALVVEAGGKSRLVTVPFKAASANGTSSESTLSFSPDGAATLVGTALVQGTDAADYRRSYQSSSGREALFEQGFSRQYPGLAVKRLEFDGLNDLEKPVRVSYALSVPHLAERDGARWRFSPFGAAPSYAESFAPLSSRHFPLSLPPPWTVEFHYRLLAPAGYRFAPPPKDVHDAAPFGSFEQRASLAPDGQTLELRGRLAIDAAEIAPADYPAFRALLEEADRAMAQPLWMSSPTETPRASR
ncbi:MAG: DUF3857 domain-containing protein [Deltaproteobacteria bacterium]